MEGAGPHAQGRRGPFRGVVVLAEASRHGVPCGWLPAWQDGADGYWSELIAARRCAERSAQRTRARTYCSGVMPKLRLKCLCSALWS